MNLGSFEIVVILLLALILYGKRLPEITRAVGKGYQSFRKQMDEIKRDFTKATDFTDSKTNNKTPDSKVSDKELPYDKGGDSNNLAG
ncbi:MAG: twin-arginine translocase TatA/TatE family subunit [Planctomycetes bacterium]|nr:twin-arginine translocase TatA/TatE family subunit [Planctomycetota bacterium]